MFIYGLIVTLFLLVWYSAGVATNDEIKGNAKFVATIFFALIIGYTASAAILLK